MGEFSTRKDLTGQVFGRLTVLAYDHTENKRAYWLCRCECGNTCVVSGKLLRNGGTKSCGCLHTKHGLKHDPTYEAWHAIKQRCFNPNREDYCLYGARGITICPAWINNPVAFIEYVKTLEHCGEKGYSLDRIDNNKNYEPGNLRYATQSEQNRNKRRNVIVEYRGEQMTLADAAEKSGINYGTLNTRYHAGDRGDRLFRPVKN